jgi:serine/threonine protein kinase
VLDRHQQGGMDIIWVPVSNLLTVPSLSPLQAAWPVDNPLIALEEGELDRAIKIICEKLLSRSGQLTYVSEDRRSRIVQEVEKAVSSLGKLELADPIGDGDVSIVYGGTLDDRQVAIKVLVESPLRRYRSAFEQFVREAQQIVHPCIVPLHEAELDGEPQFLVFDYVKAPCLDRYLASRGRPFDTDQVVTLVGELARALAVYHARGLPYGTFTSNDLFYDERNHRLLLCAVGVSSFLAANDQLGGSFPRDPLMATYLIPEQYAGLNYTAASDQYSVGLIAFELLQGIAPVTVTCPADLEGKRQFFDQPEAFAGEWKTRHPVLADILLRMLARRPEDRWRSLEEVASRLQDAESEAKAMAKQSYLKHCSAQPAFYARFYEHLFASCPEARALFRNIGDQYAKLDKALHFLLNFEGPRVEPTVLTDVAAKHRQLNVTAAQFDQFACSFLATLEAVGESAAVREAWKQAMRPGLEYLKRAVSNR